jgi:hypothetical protein
MIEIIFNPDILPTKKEWLLICKMVKQQRELTDAEIEEVAKPYCDLQNWVVDKHEFARAILRKASEK